MAINPMGLQQPFDYGIPQTITALTNVVVSGGQIAYLVSGTTQTVGSPLSTFASSDILINAPASGAFWPVGVVMTNTGSNAYTRIMTRGFVILNTEAATQAGDFLTIGTGVNVVAPVTSGTAHAQLDEKTFVGRAMMAAASGGYVLAHVNIR